MSAYIHTGWVHGKEPCTRNNNWGPELWEVERNRLRLSQSDYFDCFSFSVWDTVAISSFSSLFFVPVSRLDGRWTLLRVRHTGWTCLNWADVWYYWYPRVIQPFHHHLWAYRPASLATSTLHCSSQVLVNLLICFWSPIYPSIDTQALEGRPLSLSPVFALLVFSEEDGPNFIPSSLLVLCAHGWLVGSVPIIPSVHRQEPINSQWKTCGNIMRECNQP